MKRRTMKRRTRKRQTIKRRTIKRGGGGNKRSRSRSRSPTKTKTIRRKTLVARRTLGQAYLPRTPEQAAERKRPASPDKRTLDKRAATKHSTATPASPAMFQQFPSELEYLPTKYEAQPRETQAWFY